MRFIAQAADEAYDGLARILETRPKEVADPARLTIFPDKDSYDAFHNDAHTNFIAYYHHHPEPQIVTYAQSREKGFRRTIAHEVGHLFTSHLVGDLPRWLCEGIAEMLQEVLLSDDRAQLLPIPDYAIGAVLRWMEQGASARRILAAHAPQLSGSSGGGGAPDYTVAWALAYMLSEKLRVAGTSTWRERLLSLKLYGDRNPVLFAADWESFYGSFALPPEVAQFLQAGGRDARAAEIQVVCEIAQYRPEACRTVAADLTLDTPESFHARSLIEPSVCVKLARERIFDPDPEWRKSAVGVLALVGEANAIPDLLNDPSPDVRAAAIEGLAAGEARFAAPKIREHLGAPEAQIRRACAKALGFLGGTEDIDRITALLEDPVFAVRIAAADALGRLGDPQSAVALRGRLAQTQEAFMVTVHVALSLTRLGIGEGERWLAGEESGCWCGYVTALRRMAQEPVESLRRTGIPVEDLKTSTDIILLLHALKDSRPFVRGQAFDVLWKTFRKSFGYEPWTPTAWRSMAADRWHGWWDEEMFRYSKP